jgi:carbamate kinase
MPPSAPPSLVIALGGNALQPEAAPGDWSVLEQTVGEIAELVQAGHRIALVHGNGPQVGDLLLQNEAARGLVPVAPLDLLDAESQGQLGYMIQQRLGNHLRRVGMATLVVGAVTQILVDVTDSAFALPTKPIGPFYRTEAEARRVVGDGSVAEVAPGRWRRVVASPRPLSIVELPALRVWWESGVIAVACGGGGVPVAERSVGLQGVAAVVDRDYAAQLLATDLGAQRLIILTNVDGVHTAFGTPQQRRIDRLSATEATRLLAEGQLPPGSMGPKVQACLDFLAAGGESAVIAAVPHALAATQGIAGTEFVH